MAGFVADASAALPWCFSDEATPWTESLLDRLQAGEEILVPAHWPTELMNALIMAVRRKRIGLDRVVRFAADLVALPIRIEPPLAPLSWNDVIRMALKHNLTAYDAAYLELARRAGLSLATLDSDLRRAARAEGTALL